MKRRFSIAQFILHAIFLGICLVCLYPLALVIGISLSDETSISINGFHLIPPVFSTTAYRFVLKESAAILRAYGVTVLVTVLGTLASTLTIALYAYPLSRPDFRWRKQFSAFVFFTMLFSGGLVPWYIVCVKLLGLRNNLWALFLPYLMNAWYVLIMRTFYQDNVSQSIIESAKMDGAGEYTIFFRIVIHLAKPRHRDHSLVPYHLFLERLVAAPHARKQPQVVQPSVPDVSGAEQHPVPVQHGGESFGRVVRNPREPCLHGRPRWLCACSLSAPSSWPTLFSRNT